MKSYEYIRLSVDMGDLEELNQLSSVGFRVVAVIQKDRFEDFLLLERELPEGIKGVRA